jgi:predicted Zn finger-like uncharacterized protein
MLIVCPNCATSYQVDQSSLGATGRSVRCVRCRNVWFVRDPAPLAAIAQAHRADVEAFAGPIPDDPVPDQPAATAQGWSQDWSDSPLPDPEAILESSDSVAEWPPDGQESDPIADAPPLAPLEPIDLDAMPAVDAAPRDDIETLAARRKPRRAHQRSRWSVPVLPIAILALIALNAALIVRRADVVKVAPQTASLYAAIGLPVNLRGLAFTDVTTTTETQDGVQVLVVEGTVASTSNRVVEVPRLRFSIRNPGGQEVYAWTALPTRSLLSPGETLAFRSRLASPPPEARDVLVRFFNRRDLVAGIQ